MSLEEMAENYSKKWGVPIEEAKKKVGAFLGKKPEKKTEKTGDEKIERAPTAEELFGDPLGPISKKLFDINQGLLSTAYTQRALKNMSTPPEEIKTLTEKMAFFEDNMKGMMDLVNTTMKDMQGTLEVQKAAKEREELLEEVAGVIGPLKEKIEQLEKARGGNGSAFSELTPEKIIEVGEQATKKAEEFLKKRGFKVELPEGLTPEQVENMIKDKLGSAKQEWEKEKGADVEIESKRIEATEQVLSGVVDRVFTIFLEPIKDKIHQAIEEGKFGPQRPPA